MRAKPTIVIQIQDHNKERLAATSAEITGCLQDAGFKQQSNRLEYVEPVLKYQATQYYGRCREKESDVEIS